MSFDVITPAHMKAVLETTDAMGLHREAVRVPLGPTPGGRIAVEGSKLVLELPNDLDLTAWLASVPKVACEQPGFDALQRA